MLLHLNRNQLCIWLAPHNSSQRLQWGDGREAQHDTETQQGTDHSFHKHSSSAKNKSHSWHTAECLNRRFCGWPLLLSASFICSLCPLCVSWLWACTSSRWRWMGRGLTEKDTSTSRSNQVRSNTWLHVTFSCSDECGEENKHFELNIQLMKLIAIWFWISALYLQIHLCVECVVGI